jgi:L-lactate dehydrogenase complex protein LldG
MIGSAQSREKVLERIRYATRELAKNPAQLAEAYAALPRNYIRRGQPVDDTLIEKMIERLRDYDAEVVERAQAGLPEAIAEQLHARGKHTIVAPNGIPAAWLAPGVNWLIDRQLPANTIEAADGILTAATCGIADSGTIVLHHSATEGRRVLSLLPDWHLCILRASQVVETLPEYFSRCQQPPSLATFISGPSATADIEMTRIKGVHGPRFMVVILVKDT